MKKTILLLASALLIHAVSWSQGTLKGKIADSVTNKPLGLATITVFKAADTTIITYRLSTPDGDFKVPGIPLDLNCRVVISYSGYSVFRKEFTITASQNILDKPLQLLRKPYRFFVVTRNLRRESFPEILKIIQFLCL